MPTYPGGTLGNDTIDLRNVTIGPPAGWPVHQAWYQVDALAGNDTVYGSTYNDWINGGDGDDLLFGFAGNDALNGGNGSDTLRGGDGDDSAWGGAGDDFLYGDAGNDWLVGDGGNDRLEGGIGDDVLIGYDGNDVLIGGANNDTLFGGTGADMLAGGSGIDRAWGGSGNDVYVISGGGNDTINDGVTETGTARTDTTYDTQDRVVVSYAAADVRLYHFAGSNDLWIASASDVADGYINDGVKIENYYLGGHYTVEILQTSDGQVFSIPGNAP